MSNTSDGVRDIDKNLAKALADAQNQPLSVIKKYLKRYGMS